MKNPLFFLFYLNYYFIYFFQIYTVRKLDIYSNSKFCSLNHLIDKLLTQFLFKRKNIKSKSLRVEQQQQNYLKPKLKKKNEMRSRDISTSFSKIDHFKVFIKCIFSNAINRAEKLEILFQNVPNISKFTNILMVFFIP